MAKQKGFEEAEGDFSKIKSQKKKSLRTAEKTTLRARKPGKRERYEGRGGVRDEGIDQIVKGNSDGAQRSKIGGNGFFKATAINSGGYREGSREEKDKGDLSGIRSARRFGCLVICCRSSRDGTRECPAIRRKNRREAGAEGRIGKQGSRPN